MPIKSAANIAIPQTIMNNTISSKIKHENFLALEANIKFSDFELSFIDLILSIVVEKLICKNQQHLRIHKDFLFFENCHPITIVN